MGCISVCKLGAGACMSMQYLPAGTLGAAGVQVAREARGAAVAAAVAGEGALGVLLTGGGVRDGPGHLLAVKLRVPAHHDAHNHEQRGERQRRLQDGRQQARRLGIQ